MNLKRLVILTVLFIGMYGGVVSADSSFSVFNRHSDGTKTFQQIGGSMNTKTVSYADWHITVNSIYFSYYDSSCDGFAFTPMVPNGSGGYILGGGYNIWRLSTGSAQTGWYSGMGTCQAYWLGSRLDTDYPTSAHGDATGVWNAW